MELLEASSLFRDIAVECPELMGMNFLFIIPDVIGVPMSDGLELIIRSAGSPFREATQKKLGSLANTYKLKTATTATSFIFFTPSDYWKENIQR